MEYESALQHHALPWLKEFDPELVIVCAGFDALAVDSLAGHNLDAVDYGKMSILLRAALGPKIVLGLEGGYSLDPEGLPAAVAETVMALASAEGSDEEERWKSTLDTSESEDDGDESPNERPSIYD